MNSESTNSSVEEVFQPAPMDPEKKMDSKKLPQEETEAIGGDSRNIDWQ